MTTRESFPRWLLFLALLVVLCAHTQVTLRHLALRVAGVRVGRVEAVLDRPAYERTEPRFDRRRLAGGEADGAVLFDPMGVFRDGELAGDRIWFGDDAYPVVDNTATHILVGGTPAELHAAIERHSRYVTGTRERGPLARLALAVPTVNFTVADVLLAAAIAGLVGWLLLRRRRPRGWLVPLPLVVLAVVSFATMFDGARLFDRSYTEVDKGRSLKELLQLAEVMLAWAFFSVVFTDARARRWLGWTLAGAAALVAVVGLAEYAAILRGSTLRGLLDIGDLDSVLGFQYNSSRSDVSGSESSRNALATYWLVALPMTYAWLMAPIGRAPRIAVGVVAALALLLVLNAPLLVCVVFACLFIAARWPARAAVPATVFGALAILGLAGAVNGHQGRILLDSAALYRAEDTYGLQPMPAKGRGAETLEHWDSWQQKHVERQAAANAIGYSPLLGVGIGHYQATINTFYEVSLVDGHELLKGPVNLMEKDAHSLYLVQGVETGLLGVACLVWLLIVVLKQALAAGAGADRWDRALLAGAAGVAIALLLGSAYASFMVRGLQLIAVAVLALPGAITAAEPGA